MHLLIDRVILLKKTKFVQVIMREVKTKYRKILVLRTWTWTW